MATTYDAATEFREANRKLKDALDKRCGNRQTLINIIKENMPKLIDAANKEAVINMTAQLISGTLTGISYIMHCMDAGVDPVGYGIQLTLSVFGGIMLPKINIPVGICLITYYGIKFYRG